MSLVNMTVKTRLAASFSILLFLALVVGLVSMQRLDQLNTNIEKIMAVDWKMARLAAEIDGHAKSNAVKNIELFITNDKTATANILAEIERNKQIITADLEALDKLAYTDEGRSLLRKVKDSRKAYVASFTAASAMLLERKEREAAARQFVSETLPALDAFMANINALVEYQKGLMQQTAAASASAYLSARASVMSLIALAMVTGAVLAWLITRSLVRQLGGEPDYASLVANRIAAGDLTLSVDVRSGDTTSVLAAMKNMQSTLARMIREIGGAANALKVASQEIAFGNADLSQRTEEQASSLEETASSMEELTATVTQNASHSEQANQLAVKASGIALKGGDAVGEVVQTMNSITASSKKVGDIISVIDSIAFQTNILALNAAVEAARAGEQGRGFAVVASEVRNLAQRSASAAKEIKALIGESVSTVDNGTRLVDQAGATMEEIVASVKGVTDVISEISRASMEQKSGIEQVAQAITTMEQVTQQNAALVEQAAASAESLEEQAQQLARTVAMFRVSAGAEAASLPAAKAEAVPALSAAVRARSRKAPVEAIPRLRG